MDQSPTGFHKGRLVHGLDGSLDALSMSKRSVDPAHRGRPA